MSACHAASVSGSVLAGPGICLPLVIGFFGAPAEPAALCSSSAAAATARILWALVPSAHGYR